MKWYPHTTNHCPVGPEQMVRPRIAAISRSTAEKRELTKASGWRWTLTGSPLDIAEYQVAL